MSEAVLRRGARALFGNLVLATMAIFVACRCVAGEQHAHSISERAPARG